MFLEEWFFLNEVHFINFYSVSRFLVFAKIYYYVLLKGSDCLLHLGL